MKVNIGIVGLGKMGILHATILNALEGCSVAAICEKERFLVEFGKKIIPTIAFYNEVTDMVRDQKLDAIFITTPISTHFSIFKQIIDTRGDIPIFVEKPLASGYDDAASMAEFAGERRLVTMVGYQKRFAPSFSKAKSMLESREIGDPLMFRAYSFVSSIFKEGKGWRFKQREGGALLDLGSHLIDLLIYYFGTPEWVSAFNAQMVSSKVEDFSHAILGFKRGLTGYVDVSWSVRGFRIPETKIEIFGTRGKLEVSEDRLFVSHGYSNDHADGVELTAPDLYQGLDFLVGDPEYCTQDNYFLMCIQKGQRAHPDFLDAALVNETIEKIHESSNGKKVVWLDRHEDR